MYISGCRSAKGNDQKGISGKYIPAKKVHLVPGAFFFVILFQKKGVVN